MDAFALRDKVVGEYKDYVRSFLNVRDPRIAEFVDERMASGALSPDAILQLNPAYAQGATLEELASRGIITRETATFFRRKDGSPIRLYQHQQEAIELGLKKESFVVTTGTGSGKSLTYLVPIYDSVMRSQPQRHRVMALLVYPMNALINSQYEALRQYAERFPASPVTFERYTGQEDEEERNRILNDPPHLLLTNYVMLEYILLRPREHVFVSRATSDLEFLVLDEIHTYRGRQGADVAMLVRRVRERCGNPGLVCIGTSATLATQGSREERKRVCTAVASKLFGVPIPSSNVIDETLRRSISAVCPVGRDALRAAVELAPPAPTLQSVRGHPLAAWVEQTFGLADEEGRLVRRQSVTFAEGVSRLADETGLPRDTCERRLREVLTVGNSVRNEDGEPVFAFRLHQFIASGGSIYATLEGSERRHLTLEGSYFASDGQKLLYPLVFCRECGQEYYMVQVEGPGMARLTPRLPLMASEEDEAGENGYFLLDEDGVWEESREDELPDTWFDFVDGQKKIKPDYRDERPRRVSVSPDGTVVSDDSPDAVRGWFLKEPFLVCPRCGIAYTKREKREYGKLARLSQAGRSSATTLITVAAVLGLRDDESLDRSSCKVLSFTDNRQDASLQAGHLNDFVQTAVVRAALYRALRENGRLDHANLPQEVFRALALPQGAYAKEEAAYGPGKTRNEEAMKSLLEYRVYEDLKRAWRLTQPNLEQCGLLKVTYAGLEEICSMEALWEGHPVLSEVTPARRFEVVKAFLDHLRRELAIDVKILDPERQSEFRRRVEQDLKEPWSFDVGETLISATKFVVPPSRPVSGEERSLSARSRLGRYLRAPSTWGIGASLNTEEYESLLSHLIKALKGNYITVVPCVEEGGTAIQLLASSFNWELGDGRRPEHDPVRRMRMRATSEEGVDRQANAYFIRLYEDAQARFEGMRGGEHTAQVPASLRVQREEQFRAGSLPVLFSSPTMELGVDIADLNVVHMRNVPPTPANYAQRGGRAGRSGQPAVVFTLCSDGSSHDQYFFRRPGLMVSGAVVPARLDLSNEELIKAHIHSLWLAEAGLNLGRSMGDILEVDDVESLPLKDEYKTKAVLTESSITELVKRCKTVLESCSVDLSSASWYSDTWVEQVIRSASTEFDRAFDRWRELYWQAVKQRDEARRVMDRHAGGAKARSQKEAAQKRHQEALRQISLLMNETDDWAESDFYPYRYLSAEGFLPGYNFPRLPVRALVPHRDEVHSILRPRFLALSEFGPQNIVYHEGSKYRVSRCVLPAGGVEGRLVSAKVCLRCGYMHDADRLTVDKCDYCGTDLSGVNSEYVETLLELSTVRGSKAERITCDEEERSRLGYRITTHFRFAPGRDGRVLATQASVNGEQGKPLMRILHAPQATLWRVNHGWRRGDANGFEMDVERGFWLTSEQRERWATDGRSSVRVRPFVRDTRNLLFVYPEFNGTDPAQKEPFLATLGYALQRGLQVVFEVEEHEIEVERQGADERRGLLFWEASEGGSGTWLRLLEEPKALSEVARAALETCHFDPSDGTDLRPGDCAKACYDCLLSYSNQMDHALLDRHLVAEYLLALTRGLLVRSDCGESYEERYLRLRGLVDPRSLLEKKLLDTLYQSGRRLPDKVQYRPEPEVFAEADFFYEGRGGSKGTCVFCDGPVHDGEDQRMKDSKQRAALEDMGYQVVVIRYDRAVEEQIDEYRDVFGPGRSQ